MKHTVKKGRTARERLKLGAIPTLVLVLAVICWPGSSEDQPKFPARDRVRSVTSTSAENSAAIATVDSGPAAIWPDQDLASIVARSPFKRSPAIRRLFGEEPVAPPAPAVTDSGGLAEVRGGEESPGPAPVTIDFATVGTLQAVLQSEAGWVALIDSQVVRPGEMIGSEYRVVEISPKTVLVERIVLPAPPDGEATR